MTKRGKIYRIDNNDSDSWKSVPFNLDICIFVCRGRVSRRRRRAPLRLRVTRRQQFSSRWASSILRTPWGNTTILLNTAFPPDYSKGRVSTRVLFNRTRAAQQRPTTGCELTKLNKSRTSTSLTNPLSPGRLCIRLFMPLPVITPSNSPTTVIIVAPMQSSIVSPPFPRLWRSFAPRHFALWLLLTWQSLLVGC